MSKNLFRVWLESSSLLVTFSAANVKQNIQKHRQFFLKNNFPASLLTYHSWKKSPWMKFIVGFSSKDNITS